MDKLIGTTNKSLPELSIHNSTQKYFSQNEIDEILGKIYQERPVLYTQIAEWEKAGDSRTKVEAEDIEEEIGKIYRYIHREFNIPAEKVSAVYWELRCRSRLMFGLTL